MVAKTILSCMLLLTTLAALGQPLHERIINGYPASTTTWPWMAAIHLSNRDPLGGFLCGGTLIHPSYVLTAGHCTVDVVTNPGVLAVTLGRTTLSDTSMGVTVPVDGALVHPQFNISTLYADLALLHLAYPVNIAPVRLSFDPTDITAGAMATILGWGTVNSSVMAASDVLQQAEFPLQLNNVCIEDYGESFVPSVMFCAGTLASTPTAGDGVDACFGDSGGPVMVMDADSVVRQIGLTSWGSPTCGSSQNYGVYTRLPAFVSWIGSLVNISPRVVRKPSVRGTPRAGRTLSCRGAVVDGNNISIRYRWENSRRRVLLSGRSSTYRVPRSEVGRRLRCVVTAKGSRYTVNANSAWVGPVRR